MRRGRPGAMLQRMLTRLGARPTPADPVDLLLECHGRIRTFLALARRLAAPGDAAPAADAEVRAAAAQARRYFDEALPLHARDEELSVVPRLRGGGAELVAALRALEREHAEHEGARARLAALLGELARDPGRRATLAPALGAATEALAGPLEAHLQQEEAVVFPALRARLGPDEGAALLAELRARRSH